MLAPNGDGLPGAAVAGFAANAEGLAGPPTAEFAPNGDVLPGAPTAEFAPKGDALPDPTAAAPAPAAAGPLLNAADAGGVGPVATVANLAGRVITRMDAVGRDGSCVMSTVGTAAGAAPGFICACPRLAHTPPKKHTLNVQGRVRRQLGCSTAKECARDAEKCKVHRRAQPFRCSAAAKSDARTTVGATSPTLRSDPDPLPTAQKIACRTCRAARARDPCLRGCGRASH